MEVIEVLDVNVPTPDDEPARGSDAPDHNQTNKYEKDNDGLQTEDDRAGKMHPAVLWFLRWIGNPLLFVVALVFAAIAVGIFSSLVSAFFATPASLPAEYGYWITLGLGLLPISATASAVSIELLRRCWTVSVTEWKPTFSKKSASSD